MFGVSRCLYINLVFFYHAFLEGLLTFILLKRGMFAYNDVGDDQKKDLIIYHILLFFIPCLSVYFLQSVPTTW